MGQKSKITPELIELIVEHLKEGNYDMVAAQAAGITRQTFYRWIREGKKNKEGIYFDFYLAVEKAKAEGETELLHTIRKASSRSWTAAAWILERSRPQRWSLHKAKETAAKHWESEIRGLLKDGTMSQEDVIEVLGEDLAHELFEQAGIPITGRGKAKAESGSERTTEPAEVPEKPYRLR